MSASVFCALRVDCRPPLETIEVEEYDPVSCNSGTTTPGEDIWTKFEMENAESLYPTPPLSPENKLGSGPQCGYWQPADMGQFGLKSDLDMDLGLDTQMLSMSWLSDEQNVDLTPLFELDYELSRSSINPKRTVTQQESSNMDGQLPGLKKSLIQDCMWSAYKKLLQKDTDKSEDKTPVKTTSESREYSVDCNQPSDCVDPTAVFPYPLSIAETRLDLGNIAGTTTPSDSEEEIDVVTIATTIGKAIELSLPAHSPVDHKARFPVDHKARSPVDHKVKPREALHSHKHKHRRESTAFSSPEHDYAKPRMHHDFRFTLKRTSKYSTGTTTTSTHHHHSSGHKRRKLHSGGVNAEEVARRLQNWDPKSRGSAAFTTRPYNSSSRGSSKAGSKGSSLASSHSASDSEDCDKRVSHNVLERKRRDDLRTAFFQLRDSIPHLTSKERVSKVVILEESRNYAKKLREQHARLAGEKDTLSRRRRELSARLRELKAAHQRKIFY